MTLRTLLAVLLLVSAGPGWGADGLITLPSAYSPKETLKRLEQGLKAKGMTIFARIDHAAGAAKVGMKIRPTEVVIFGNPKGGTPLIECAQTVGIDLPLKALVWEDAAGQVWLSYNDPAYLAARHGAPECPAVGKLSKALAGFTREATVR
jgi:uncharacterized protein (DUF302 family)